MDPSAPRDPSADLGNDHHPHASAFVAQLAASHHTKQRSYSPARSRTSTARLSYSDHLQQQQQQQLSASSAKFTFPNTPSTSSQQFYGDPSPSISRIGDSTNGHADDDLDEPLGAALGSSKRRRGRNNSHSSYGSSVLPAAYNPHAYRGLVANASLPSRHGPPPAGQGRRYRTSVSRPSNGVDPNGAARVGASEVENWLRASYNPDAHASNGQASSATPDGGALGSPTFQAFAPPGRLAKKSSGMTLSEAGSARGRGGPGSASGLSVGVMSAGAAETRHKRKESSIRRDANGVAAAQGSLGAVLAVLAGPDAAADPSNLRVDSIEEWRAKSSAVSPRTAGAAPDELRGAEETRHRIKSSARKDSDLGRCAAQPTQDGLAHLSASSALSPPIQQQRWRSTSRVPSIAPSTAHFVLGVTSSAPLPNLLALSGHSSQEDTPIRRFFRWMSKEGLRSVMTPATLLSVLLVKWSVGRGDWSGKGSPPMFGDFEAQRHWVELTLHLPTSQWYFYDLQYWGLDYPPLTAWFSLACGYVARTLPSVGSGFEFVSSRGDQNDATVTFMRASVVFFDYVIYVPAVALFLSRRLEGRGRRTSEIALLSILLQPGLILIDNGHFQYNSVMLGFATACFALLYTTLPNPSAVDRGAPTAAKQAKGPAGATAGKRSGRITDLSRRLSYEYVLAAFSFCLSLCFKQMALYYAPAVFAVMLGRCIGLVQVDPERGLSLFCGLGLSVIATFGIVFAPWLTSLEQIGQIIHRIFPLARGLFEDKVANLWCFLSVLPIPQRFKVRNLLSVPALARLSLLTTLVMILPGCLMLYAAAVETAQREMMVADSKMLEEAMAKSSTRRQSVSSVATLDDRLSSPVSPTDAKRTAPHTHNRSRRSGERAASISGSIVAGRGTSEIYSLLAGSTCGGGSGDAVRRPASLLPQDSAPDQAVASTLPSPAAMMLPYGLVSVSMAFFLFGFQTHEKSILLPLLPLTLLLGAKGDQWGGSSSATDWHWAVLGNNVGAFSMYPLLKRDGQGLQYVVLLVGWNWLIGARFWRFRGAGLGQLFGFTIHIAILLLHLLELLLPTVLPQLQAEIWRRYPDIYPVLNVWLSTPVFVVLWIWATARQWQIGFGCAIQSFIWTGIVPSSTSAKAKKRNEK
ncbi:Glucosyltransferase-like protein [Thecaphora frezii]